MMRPSATSKTSNLTIRLTEIERSQLERKAKAAKLPLASFARLLFRKEISDESSDRAEVVQRLVDNADSLNAFRATFVSTSERLELAILGAVAASAMLKDNGRTTEEQATAVVIAHIDEALDAAPGILNHRRKSDSSRAA